MSPTASRRGRSEDRCVRVPEAVPNDLSNMVLALKKMSISHEVPQQHQRHNTFWRLVDFPDTITPMGAGQETQTEKGTV